MNVTIPPYEQVLTARQAQRDKARLEHEAAVQKLLSQIVQSELTGMDNKLSISSERLHVAKDVVALLVGAGWNARLEINEPHEHFASRTGIIVVG